jgi:signal recognition particle subunit SEC65
VSAGKLVKLRRLMRELSIEDPRAGELRDAVRVMEVMES